MLNNKLFVFVSSILIMQATESMEERKLNQQYSRGYFPNTTSKDYMTDAQFEKYLTQGDSYTQPKRINLKEAVGGSSSILANNLGLQTRTEDDEVTYVICTDVMREYFKRNVESDTQPHSSGCTSSNENIVPRSAHLMKQTENMGIVLTKGQVDYYIDKYLGIK